MKRNRQNTTKASSNEINKSGEEMLMVMEEMQFEEEAMDELNGRGLKQGD